MSKISKVALVTGASSGLGAEFAKLFAADGHDVVVVARRRVRLEQLATEIKSTYNQTAQVLECDLTQVGAIEKLGRDIDALGINIEYLVNNAGFGSTGPFAKLDIKTELQLIDLNVRALVECTHRFVGPMLSRGSGKILNIGSTAGFQGGPFMATYYASKAFVNHFSEALSVELEGTGVTVTVSCPGATATEFSQVSGNDKSKLFAGAVASSQTVAQHAYNAMMKGKRMAVVGFKNKILVQSLRLSPRAAVLGIARKLNRP